MDIWKDLDYEECISFQKELLESSVKHPLAVKYPPSSSYVKLFLKKIITQIEQSGQEVCEELYEVYTGLLANGATTNDFSYRTYTYPPNIQITLKETSKLVTDGTTGMFTWEASHVLVEYCLKNPHLFKEKNILELGSGLGLTGLSVIVGCQPQSYIFTDHHETVLSTLATNVLININNNEDCQPIDDWSVGFQSKFKNTKIHIKSLDWEDDVALPCCEIVLAADVVYDVTIIPALLNTLMRALRNNLEAVAYIALTIRRQETLDIFDDSLG